MRAQVGNDVVDLDDPDNARSFRRPGYVERVCGERERESLEASVEPERLFWSYFAAKEAAYKLLTKLGESPGFAHRNIEVAGDLRSVGCRGRELVLEVTGGEGFVHAVATLERTRVDVAVRRAEGDLGHAARLLLARLVAPHAECAADEVQIERDEAPGTWDGRGPPFVTRAGAALDVDVSLSHDGRFVAAAAAVP